MLLIRARLPWKVKLGNSEVFRLYLKQSAVIQIVDPKILSETALETVVDTGNIIHAFALLDQVF